MLLGDEFIDGPSNRRKAMEWLMVSGKALYWMAVGVAALFLGNSFVGGRSLTPRVADRSMATTLAQVIFGGSQAGFVQAQSATACAETRLAVVQTAMAHREAALAKVQAERIRVLANRAAVAHPRQNLVINLPEVPGIVPEGTI